LLTECLKDPSFFFRVINGLKISYITALVFLFIQVIIGLKFTFYPGLSINTVDPVFHVVRYPGVFFDSQAHGQFLAIGSFLFLFHEKGTSKKTITWNYLLFIATVVGIVFAGSRAALGGFGLGVVLIVLLAGRKYLLYGILFSIIGAIIYFTVLHTAGIFDRTKNLSDDYLFRKGIWDEAFDISKKHPYLGIGSGNYQKYVMKHVQDQYLEIEDGKLVYFDQPENGYLKIIVELGYLGFAVFALFILQALKKGLANKIKGIFDSRVVFFMSALISWLVAFNTVYSIYDYRILIMVACMVVLILAYPPNKENDEDELVEG
jgi:O-antigen ligase